MNGYAPFFRPFLGQNDGCWNPSYWVGMLRFIYLIAFLSKSSLYNSFPPDTFKAIVWNSVGYKTFILTAFNFTLIFYLNRLTFNNRFFGYATYGLASVLGNASEGCNASKG
jgi:hypothetical protein